MAGTASGDAGTSVENLDSPSQRSATKGGTDALDLVFQAAEIIKRKEAHAADVEARAEAIIKRAIEELRLAESRVHSAEQAQKVAESRVREAEAAVYEIESKVQKSESLIAAAQVELAAAELRATVCRSAAAKR
jgi:hypothetical protein